MELKDGQALLLAFDKMCAAFDELKAVGGRRNDFFADESDGFGIGIDGLAEALQPLRCVHRIADNRVVDPVRRADIADNDRAHMDADADSNRLLFRGDPASVVRRERALDGDGSPASRSGRVLNAARRAQKAMTASPMNLSMVPPSRSMQAERSERW